MRIENLKIIAESPLSWAILAVIFVLVAPHFLGADGKEYIIAVLAVIISRIRSPKTNGGGQNERIGITHRPSAENDE